MRRVGQPYWRLRDYLRSGAVRKQRGRAESWTRAAVMGMAGEEPTYGYCRVYHALRQRRIPMGRERVRRLMGALGLQPPSPIKKKHPSHAVVAERNWPVGRRLQIDATRFRLDDGVAWVSLVEDANSRQCVAAGVAPTLRQERAAATLLEGHGR